MEIIILMIVVSVIANIIKSAGQVQKQTKRTGRGIPGQGPGRDIHLPGSQPPSFDTYPMGETDYSMEPEQIHIQEKIDMESSLDRKTSSKLDESSFAPMAGLSRPASSAGIAKPLEVIGAEQVRNHRLDLTQDGIINGIILSEVLGSPVSRR